MGDSAEGASEGAEVQVVPVAAGARRRVLWLILAGVLVFCAGGATAFLLLRGGDEDVAAKPWVPPRAETPIGGGEVLDEASIQKYCLDQGGKQTVIAYFDGDDPDTAMRQTAQALRDDDRVASVDTETRQEAYERFKEIFADQPELVKLARPEALPASVTLLPADGVYVGDLANAVVDEFSLIESLGAGCQR